MRVQISPSKDGLPPDLGDPCVPGSKSHTQRAMLLAAGHAHTTVLRGALRARDTEVLGRALEQLGARVAWSGQDIEIEGPLKFDEPVRLDLDENGTALRMLGVVVPMLAGRARIDGAAGLAKRPIDEILTLLDGAGAGHDTDRLPIEVDGTCARWEGPVTTDASRTTQVASGILLGTALRRLLIGADAGPDEIIIARPSAGGYLLVTVATLRDFGFPVDVSVEEEAWRLRIGPPGQAPAVIEIGSDPSALAFPAALAAMHGHPWKPPAMTDNAHPDLDALEALASLAARPDEENAEIEGLGRHPDAFGALCTLAATRSGQTQLLGAPALRLKESDRIAAMARGLEAVGILCEERPDGLVLRGPVRSQDTPIELPTVPDHRIIMALALLGTITPVMLDGGEAVDKSWPGYFNWLARVARVEC